MGIGRSSESASASRVVVQSPVVLVNVSVAERTPASLAQMACSIRPSWCPISIHQQPTRMGIGAQARRLHSANAGQNKSVNACSLTTVPSRVGKADFVQSSFAEAQVDPRTTEW